VGEGVGFAIPPSLPPAPTFTRFVPAHVYTLIDPNAVAATLLLPLPKSLSSARRRPSPCG